MFLLFQICQYIITLQRNWFIVEFIQIWTQISFQEPIWVINTDLEKIHSQIWVTSGQRKSKWSKNSSSFLQTTQDVSREIPSEDNAFCVGRACQTALHNQMNIPGEKIGFHIYICFQNCVWNGWTLRQWTRNLCLHAIQGRIEPIFVSDGVNTLFVWQPFFLIPLSSMFKSILKICLWSTGAKYWIIFIFIPRSGMRISQIGNL